MLNLLKQYKFLILATIIFVALSTVGISRSIWFDESYSMYLTKGNFSQITEMTALDVHPPLYYWLLKIWAFIFGDSVTSFRSFSVLAGVFAIIGIYLLLKRWFSEKNANFLIFFLAINPFFLFYATETRMYTLIFALMAFSTFTLDIALEKKTFKYWFFYFILITLGLYSHYFFGVVIAIQFIYLLKHNFSWKNLLVYPALVVAYLPWVPVLISQVTEVGHGFWIEPVNFETVLQFFSWSLIYFEYPFESPFYLILIISVIILAIATAIFSMKKLKDKEVGNLGMFILFPPLILVIISVFYVPVYVPRYIIYALALLPVFLVLIAKMNIKNIFSKMLIVTLVVCAGFGIYNIYYTANYNDNQVVNIIEGINKKDREVTPIIVNNVSPNYYDAVLSDTERHHVLVYQKEFYWGSIMPIKSYNLNYLEDFEQFKAENDEFWLLVEGDIPTIKGFETTDYVDFELNFNAAKYTKAP